MSDYYVPQPLFWLLPLSRSGLLNLAHVFPYSEFELLKSMILCAHSVWAKITIYHHSLFYLGSFKNCKAHNPLAAAHQSP